MRVLAGASTPRVRASCCMASLARSSSSSSTSFDCSLCNFSSPNRSLWLSHLRGVHSQDENFSIVCGINECSASYVKCSSFVSHVYRQHREALTNSTNNIHNSAESSQTDACEYNTSESGILLDETDNEPTSVADMNLRHTIDQLLETDEVVQKEKVALYILNLKDVRGLSESAVEHVVKETQAIFHHTIGRIQAKVSQHLSRNGVDLSTLPNLDNVYTEVTDPFQGLNTTHLQEKFYREHFGCIVSITRCTCTQLLVYYKDITFVYLYAVLSWYL